MTEKIETTEKIELEGLKVSVFRGTDDKLVVDIDTRELDAKDEHENRSPDIRLWINEQRIETDSDGKLLFED